MQVVFDLARQLALRQFQAPFPDPAQADAGQAVFSAPPGFPADGPLDELVLVDTLTGAVHLVWNADMARATTRALAWQAVRDITVSKLSATDDLPARRAEALRLDRGNPDAIAAWFAVLGARDGVRQASNAAQAAVLVSSGSQAAWAIADAWKAASPPPVDPPPIVSRAAFFQRLGVTPAEQADPVMQVAWQHLSLHEYVDLRLAGAFLAPLVAAGKLTQGRVDAALDAGTVTWPERHLSL